MQNCKELISYNCFKVVKYDFRKKKKKKVGSTFTHGQRYNSLGAIYKCSRSLTITNTRTTQERKTVWSLKRKSWKCPGLFLELLKNTLSLKCLTLSFMDVYKTNGKMRIKLAWSERKLSLERVVRCAKFEEKQRGRHWSRHLLDAILIIIIYRFDFAELLGLQEFVQFSSCSIIPYHIRILCIAV